MDGAFNYVNVRRMLNLNRGKRAAYALGSRYVIVAKDTAEFFGDIQVFKLYTQTNQTVQKTIRSFLF